VKSAGCAGRGLSSPRRRARGLAGQRGVTLVEAMIAVAILAAGAITAMSLIVSALRLDMTNRETRAAFDAARAQIERLRAEPFDRIPLMYDADPANDPDGAGTAPGNVFAVDGLTPSASGATGAGEVLVPADGAGAIREDSVIPEIGMPRDLDGDNVVDSLGHTHDAIALPVLVRVRWTGGVGAREIFVSAVLHR